MNRFDEIRKRYEISTNDIDEIKSILKNKLKESHPDNGGNVDSAYFAQVKEDLDYVQDIEKKQDMLVPVGDVIKSLAEIMVGQTKYEVTAVEKLNAKLNESVRNQIETNKERRKVSRYSSASIAAVVTFIWMFPEKVLEHPVIKMLFGSNYGENQFVMFVTCVWMGCLFLAVYFWFDAYKSEKDEKKILEKITLESVQNNIFMSFVEKIKPQKTFYKDKFVNYLKVYFINGYVIGTRRNRKNVYSEELIQNIADIIVLRAKEMGLIENKKSNNLIDCFEIHMEEE